MQVNAGTQVRLINVTPTELTVDFQGSTQKVPVNSTDLVNHVKAAGGCSTRAAIPASSPSGCRFSLNLFCKFFPDNVCEIEEIVRLGMTGLASAHHGSAEG